MKNEKLHSTLLALVGGYILFLAYEIYGKYKSGAGEMPDVLYILIITLFTLGGIAVLFYSWKVYKASLQQEKNNAAEEQEKPKDEQTASDEAKGR